MPPFQPGHPKYGGRKPGSLNKFRKSEREIFREVFEALQDDPMSSLFAWGALNPTEFYKLWTKLAPKDVNVEAQINLINDSHAARLERALEAEPYRNGQSNDDW